MYVFYWKINAFLRKTGKVLLETVYRPISILKLPTYTFKLCKTGFHPQCTHRHREDKSI